MRRTCGMLVVALVAAVAPTSRAEASPARGLDIELWTDRGADGVYQPGQTIGITARTSDDAYLLVYEIDSEGAVHALFPQRGSRGFIEGRRSYAIPPAGSDVELVVEGPVGEGYIVGIASERPFRNLPWYLRPVDAQAGEIGYQGEGDDEEEGVTQEGRIVGDPFVAMERIRRRVLEDPEDPSGFATAYVSYYVHNQVRYPRYLCYDCHRPNHWAWWDGFDPYYTTCSAIDFRVNWAWAWGPSYWNGFVPYYYYVYRPSCPPRYRGLLASRTCYSSWDGWKRWSTLWGSRLTRFRSDPPSGYVPPSKFRNGGVWGDDSPAPPGFSRRDATRGVRGGLAWVPRGSERVRDGVRPIRKDPRPQPSDDPRFRPRRPDDLTDPGSRAADPPWRVLRPNQGARPEGRDRVEPAPAQERRVPMGRNRLERVPAEERWVPRGRDRMERIPAEERRIPMGRDLGDLRPERGPSRDGESRREITRPDPPREERRHEEKRRSDSERGDGSRSRPWREGR
ncbi:MAG: DUF4384 domain-containing protein [Candidatus Eisenbacteria bacterium]|uniref:DUF4384 domain-containing protein n=1 Tax=Eiseniibacteriota bacterium TaxID=2212470 RepID=A0A538TNY7_UNCEI|nr:MAG: DUF4384 domain-containing protein [Candidatus Eisenbacteria bacterium]